MSDKPVLRGGIAINDVEESSLDKLGWFRWEGNTWSVRNGLVKMTQAQHVQVQDCKAQTYLATINAEQHVLEGNEEKVLNFNLGTPVDADPWVGAVEIGARSVRIDHAEGTNLLLTLKAQSNPRAVYHISQFSSFNGSIQLDKDSNRYLNLTFEDARGTLVGQVFSTDSKAEMDIVFSVQTSDNPQKEFRAIIALPVSVDSRRFVCIHASGDLDSQLCKWLDYKASPLREYRVAHRWQQSQSECRGCNERGVEYFFASLDPMKWFGGLNTPVEMATALIEVIGVVILLGLIILGCTKFICPCCCWIVRVPKVPKKK